MIYTLFRIFMSELSPIDLGKINLNERINNQNFGYENNEIGTDIAATFSASFAEHEAVRNHALELMAVPVNNKALLDLTNATVSVDGRNMALASGTDTPIALRGIDPKSKERTGMTMLIVGRQRAIGATFEPVGVRNLTMYNQADLTNSYGFAIDPDGRLTRVSYATEIEYSENALARVWTYLNPRLGETKVTGTGIGEAMGEATAAVAKRLAELEGGVTVLGEQMGLLIPAMMNKLIAATVEGPAFIDDIRVPLHEILGYESAEEAFAGNPNKWLPKVEDALNFGAIPSEQRTTVQTRQWKAYTARLQLLLGGDSENWRSHIEEEFSLKPLIRVGNPSAARQFETAKEMGLKEHAIASGVSAGVPLTGGPVYSGRINP
jgi:hypothetical protein